jgi:hypothetical protein
VTLLRAADAGVAARLPLVADLAAAVSDPLRVGGQSFKLGLVDSANVHADVVLLADGGVFAAEGVTASTSATPGPRVLRIKAEGKNTKGLRAAHAVDFGPFEVK